MKPIYSIFILFAASCSDQVKPTKKISYEDSIITKLIGKWGGSGESRPVWEIRKDSIYYFEHSKAYPYKIVGQDMIVNLPNSSQMKLGNIQVIKDTLLFDERPGLTVQAVRFK